MRLAFDDAGMIDPTPPRYSQSSESPSRGAASTNELTSFQGRIGCRRPTSAARRTLAQSLHQLMIGDIPTTDSCRPSIRQQSQALVELALVLPVLMIILLGMADLGRAFVYGVAVEQGAHQGARVAAAAALDTNVTDTVVLQRMILASAPAIIDCTTTLNTTQSCGGGSWTLSINVTPASGSPTYTSLSAARSGQSSLSGAQVEVRAHGSVSMYAGVFAGALGLSSISVQGDAVMVIV